MDGLPSPGLPGRTGPAVACHASATPPHLVSNKWRAYAAICVFAELREAHHRILNDHAAPATSSCSCRVRLGQQAGCAASPARCMRAAGAGSSSERLYPHAQGAFGSAPVMLPPAALDMPGSCCTAAAISRARPSTWTVPLACGGTCTSATTVSLHSPPDAQARFTVRL